MLRTNYYISVLTVTIGGSTQFYSYDIVNPEQEILTEWINETYYNRNGSIMNLAQLNFYWSVVVASIAVGAIFGALQTRHLAEMLGRRNALIVNGILNIVGSIFQFLAKSLNSPELLIAGRFINGINMGLASSLVPLYLLEITPLQYRGTAGTMHQAAVAFSDWFSLFLGLPEIIGGKDYWPIAFGFPGILALFLVCILPFCPESPKYTLITKGNREKALKDLEKLVTTEYSKSMFEDLLSESTHFSNIGKGSYKELFTRKDLRYPLFIAICMMIAQQMTGCGAVFAYSTDMMLNAKLSPQLARFSTLALGISYFIFACSAAFLIERVGRRALSIFQLGSITITLISISFFSWIQRFTTGIWADYITIASLLFYMCAYGIGSPIPWMITGEIFPTQFRSTAITTSVTVSWFLVFLVSLLYLPFKEMVGISLSYFPFIIISAISTFFVYFFLPETKNKKVEEIAEDIQHRSRLIILNDKIMSFIVLFRKILRRRRRRKINSDGFRVGLL